MPAASGNDQMANAFALHTGPTVTGNSTGYTIQTGEYLPDADGITTATAWFTWQSPGGSSSFTFDASATSFPCIMTLYDIGSATTPTTSNVTFSSVIDTTDGLGSPVLTISASLLPAGRMVAIQLGGYNGSSLGWQGPYSITYHLPQGGTLDPVTVHSSAAEHGVTTVHATAHVRPPIRVYGTTTVQATAYQHPGNAIPDPVRGGTSVALNAQLGDLDVTGGTSVAALASISSPPSPDLVMGTTTVDVAAQATVVVGTPDTVTCRTAVSDGYVPDLSDNPPITLALDLSGDLDLVPPDLDDLGSVARLRTMPSVSITMPTPVIVMGKPTMPANVGVLSTSATLQLGNGHIRSISPNGEPPAATTRPMRGRWVVDDLPDPNGGSYWLGEPSSADGTARIGGAARQWRPHATTPSAPTWHSYYPYKPSVRAVDAYLPSGDVVHHPKGVHFNPAFVEHMWLDMGRARRQPFTWVIVGMFASFPTEHYRHYLLDAGRSPHGAGMPPIGANDIGGGFTVNDDLDYRTLLAYSPDHEIMCTRRDIHSNKTVRTRAVANLHPRMFFGVFNGDHSTVGHYASGSRHLHNGDIDNGPDQLHRFYVLGRSQGFIDPDYASHMLLFEIRYWEHAMDLDELDDQFGELSSTYQFHRYRRVR